MGYENHGQGQFEYSALTITGGTTVNTMGADPQVLNFNINEGAAVNTRGVRTTATKSASSSITVNVPGWYRIVLNGYFSSMATAKPLTFLFYKNGVAIANALTIVTPLTGILDASVHLERTVWLDAGDVLKLYIDGEQTNCVVTPVNVEFAVTPVG